MELFYYTTTQTMQYILQNGDIFATNLRYMNDSEEYLNGLGEIYRLVNNETIIDTWKKNNLGYCLEQQDLETIFCESVLEKNKRDLDYYSISFCEKNDLLSQWAIYAKESGVSIKMNFEEKSYIFSDQINVEDDNCSNGLSEEGLWNMVPQKVIYLTRQSMQDNSHLYEQNAIEILNRLFPAEEQIKSEDDLEARWKYVSTYVKRYDFYQEAEYRLTFDLKRAKRIPEIKFRNDKNVLKPYIDIFCKNGWPIWEVMVGPGFNQEIVFNSIKTFLDHATVKNHINSIQDYIFRIEEYLKKCDKIDIPEFQHIQDVIADARNDQDIDECYVKTTLYYLINKIRDKIINGEESDCKEYFKSHYFSRAGIILTKSNIPYIF